MFNIHNLPENHTRYAYITAVEDNDELWFFGAWNNLGRALAQAVDIDGKVYRSCEVNPV